MMRRTTLLAGAASLALGLLALQPAAHAALIQVVNGGQLSAKPISVSLGTGVFSFTLDPSGFQSDVMTSGSALVTSFFGGVDDLEVGAPVNSDPGNVYTFASFPTPSLIPSSAADDYIGLSFTDSAGATHYGYAEVFGTAFVGYAYQSTPNTGVTTSPVPEPASAAVLVTGLAVVGLARRRRQSSGRKLAA